MCCQVFPIVYLLTRARGQGRPCARYQRFSNKNTSRVVQKCQRNRLKNHFHPCHVLHKSLYLPKVHPPFTHECFVCYNHNVTSTMENMQYRILILFYFSGLWLCWCIVHASCVNYDTLSDRNSERTLQQDYFVCKQSGMAGQWPLSTDSKQIFFEILFTQLADALGDIKTLFSVLFRFGDFDVALSCLCGG